MRRGGALCCGEGSAAEVSEWERILAPSAVFAFLCERREVCSCIACSAIIDVDNWSSPLFCYDKVPSRQQATFV